MLVHSHNGLAKASQKMRDDGLPAPVVTNFERLFTSVLEGQTGVITEAEISPVQELDTLEKLHALGEPAREGMKILDKLVVVRLNGGLGTTMGLERAKSLLAVKGEYSFNDILALQLRELGRLTGVSIPLIHMTSFSTDADVQEAMRPYSVLNSLRLPTSFLQHRHPKIYADTFLPAGEGQEDLNWNPPGHGDIYAALLATGLAEHLLSIGKRYLFVANADNLGATVDAAILGYFAISGAPFLMETAARTKADAKGGHLAIRRSTGRLLLRESSQAPTTPAGEIIPEFQDVDLYKHFNTNNIWLDLKAVVQVARDHDGAIPLPLIINRKTVNPRDKTSRKVIQIETAMGAAIEVFERSIAIQVPRTRFAPVKSNNDLLVVRSDAYTLNDDYTMTVNPARKIPALPIVSLESNFYGLLKDFEARMRVIPSLVDAETLSVKGDVTFSHPVKVVGCVLVSTQDARSKVLPSGVSILGAGEHVF